MRLHSQQNTFTQIKINQSYQHWEPVGVEAFQDWCQSYPQASGGVWSLQKTKSTTDEFHCALIRNESKNNKGELAKIRRKKNLGLFLKNLCCSWMWIPARVESWVQNQILRQRLSQPINVKALQVWLDRSLHALVPRIDSRETASARVHFRFNYLCNTTHWPTS